MGSSKADSDVALFCERHYPLLVGFLSLYTSDHAASEEIAQESLTRLCSSWKKVRRMDNPDRWLRRVAINLARSRYRRWRSESRAVERLSARTREAHNDIDVATRLSVRRAIAALPDRQKAVIVLHYYCDLPFREVAETLDLPEGTVKSLAHRAAEHMRRHLSPIDA